MNEDTERIKAQLAAFADHLANAMDVVLDDWHQRVLKDAGLAIVARLPREQFVNHIPDVISTLCTKLREWPVAAPSVQQPEFPKDKQSHSRHRWQWGFDLPALVSEWGHLNAALTRSVDDYALARSDFDFRGVAQAHQLVADLLRESLTQNVADYYGLLQSEAAARLQHLQKTIEQVREVEQTRAELLRGATHDLRGSLGIVTGSMALLDHGQHGELPDMQRLRRGVDALRGMLTNLMDMSRLEAGHEQRETSAFDAAVVLNELCLSSQALAQAKQLTLDAVGPTSFPVFGDEVKLRRIVQNLLLNSLKYTERGGVTLSWGPYDAHRWMLSIQDTGPGFEPELKPYVEKLQQADEDPSVASSRGAAASTRSGCRKSPPAGRGEGVGLTIVKRLCELLDATLELETKPKVGTTFRIILPLDYA